MLSCLYGHVQVPRVCVDNTSTTTIVQLYMYMYIHARTCIRCFAFSRTWKPWKTVIVTQPSYIAHAPDHVILPHYVTKAVGSMGISGA